MFRRKDRRVYFEGVSKEGFGETTFELSPGDMMLLYTDGVTEAENNEQVQYGMDRLTQALVMLSDLPVEKIVAGILDDVMRWIGDAEVHDDITLVLVRKAA